MDYRDKNPNISYWKIPTEFDLQREASLYEGPNVSHICEFIPPDASTTFLAIYGGGEEDENFDLSTVRYLIEAPPECPMRRAFEIGDITWEDFWSHKGWLIEATTPSLFSDSYIVRYIHPSQMGPYTTKFIAEHSDKSPIQLKYDALCRQRQENRLSKKFAMQLEELERKYYDHLIAA